MDSQASTAKSYLECMLFNERMTAKALPFSLLYCITNGFSDNQQIGHGRFAEVYKGLLENGTIAVNKLLSQKPDFDEGKFSGEVRCMMKAKHKNIVRLLGYCSDTQGQWVESVMADVRERLLCFEYLPNGGLDKYIKDSSREWGRCYQIIKGICEGLQYLHDERIVHSDLKPDNILLGNDMVPKITDFGISRCFDEKQSHTVTSKIAGTLGYFAPEVFQGRISYKSDIYSLGVIIIEILTAEEGCPVGEDVLEYWSDKVDESQKEQQLEQIRVCTEVGQSCLTYDPEKRPCAQHIIDIFEQTESKERLTETGAGSSTVLQASSLVENKNKFCISSTVPQANSFMMNKNKSTSPIIPQASSLVENKNKFSRRYFSRNAFGARKHWDDPETVARSCKVVVEAICEFYAQGPISMSFEDLYRHGYNLVLYKKGEELYSAMETAMTSEVQSLCGHLDAAPVDGALFLQELLAKWNQHIRAVKLTNYMLMYMDRTFIPFNNKTPIEELGLHLWRDRMARSDKIRTRLIGAAKRQRGGEDELVAGINMMLTELGAEVMNVPCP